MIRKSYDHWTNILTTIAICLLLVSCSTVTNRVATIRIKGSSTMLNLTELLAQEYMKQHPGISIYVFGGGSEQGIKALSLGEVDLAMTSRKLTAEEIKKIADQYHSLGMSYLIAKDAVSIYINKHNPVKTFSTEQLKNIFTGKITNWKELGGKDAKIIPVTRTPNSGTYMFFQQHILEGAEYGENCIVKATSESILEFIDSNEFALGYGGIGYLGKDEQARVNNIEPSEENVINDVYPITRYLSFFSLKQPRGAVKDFIDWTLSSDGQKIIKTSGYIPLWSIKY